MAKVKSTMIGYSRRDQVFEVVLYSVMTLIGFITIYPFINVLAISFNDAIDTVRGGIYFLPREFTWANYAEIFKNDQLLTAFKISGLRTVIGTALGLVGSAMLAFTLSHKEFMARRWLSFAFAVTMYVHGGMIPSYLLMRSLGLFNSFWVYILPGFIGVWNVFVIRSYIDGLPDSLQESAKIDGANDLVIFFRIIMPLSMPVLATISLFIAVGQWNAWFDTYLYNSSSEGLTTLQYELQKLLSYAQMEVSQSDINNPNALRKAVRVTPQALKMAMTIVATVPILCVYPFIQKYFIKGMTLGAVKS